MATLQTAPNFHSEENPTITYSIGSHIVSADAGIFNTAGSQSYVPYREISKTETSYTFELTDGEVDNLLRAMGDNNSLYVRFYIRTKNSNGEYFYSYQTKTFYIAKPIVTASVVDDNETTIALTGDKNKLIKYYSNAKAEMEVTARKGAAIDENLYIIRNGLGNTAYGTSCIFENVENSTFVFQAEDDKGNVGQTSKTLPMVDYVKLTCNMDSRNKPDGLGNMTVACTGNYFDNTFGKVANTLTVQCRYTTTNSGFGDDWIDMTVTKLSGNSYYAAANFVISDFSQTQIYVFEVRAEDKLSEIFSNPYLTKSTPVFHWGENDFVFEVPVTTKGDQTITGDLRLKGSGRYGNYLRFGDADYCYIAELTDDSMTLHADAIKFDTDAVYMYGNPIPTIEKGVWTPSLYASAIASYTTQYGWYSKIGQTVCVGFYIKAKCNTGYDNTSISISGLPFTPMFATAGGGMCSGAYISANCNFQCFVAETSGTISTRIQACNNTTAQNLTTSATGCFYRAVGGEITLSGTITYMSTT